MSCSCRTRHGHSSKVRLETYEASLQFTAASEWRLCHPGLSSHLEPEFLLLARKTTENVWKPLNTLVCWSGNGQQNDSLHSGTRIWKIFATYGCWIPKTRCQVWSLWTFSILEAIVRGEWLKQMSSRVPKPQWFSIKASEKYPAIFGVLHVASNGRRRNCRRKPACMKMRKKKSWFWNG